MADLSDYWEAAKQVIKDRSFASFGDTLSRIEKNKTWPSGTIRQIESGDWKQTRTEGGDIARYRVAIGRSREGYHTRADIQAARHNQPWKETGTQWGPAFKTEAEAKQSGARMAARNIERATKDINQGISQGGSYWASQRNTKAQTEPLQRQTRSMRM
jgi:hypothetical protein